LQSPEFAIQRANELQIYLNQVARHPIACQSQACRLFLSLQDDLGVAWPEVSSNALTRFSAVGVSATMKFAEQAGTATAIPKVDMLSSEGMGATEDSAARSG